ncbi:MAG: aaaT [Chlamydiales bacterium]|nr:aaaT [Chlamydiales bacterium]
MKRNVSSPLLLGIILGLVTGYLRVDFLLEASHVVSNLFLNLLKLISLPIVFLSITSTLSGMRGWEEMKLLGKKVLTYTLLTTIVAATIALILFLVIDPAARKTELATTVAEELIHAPQRSYLSFVLQIIPSNIIAAFLENNVIGIAFLAFLVGFSTLSLPKESKDFLHQLFGHLFALLVKMTQYIIKLMPLAVWAFSVILYEEMSHGLGQFKGLMLYLVCVTGANLVQGFIFLPLLLRSKGISPWNVAKGMFPALTLAFFSKSSNSTMPLAIECAEKNLKVSPKVSKFTFPLCTVINMNGCAAFILITVLFVASLNGITFSTFDYMLWIGLATLAAIGNAGVPMGCYFLASSFLVGMNIPIQLMGLILPFYTLLDMVETSLNIWSDSCVAVIVEKEVK